MNHIKNAVIFAIQSVKFILLYLLTRHFKYIKTGLLIIRNDNLGDMLISLPMIEQAADAIHKKNKTVTLVVSQINSELLKKFHYADNLVIAGNAEFSNGFFWRLKAFRKISAYRAEKVILLLSLGRSGEHDYAVLLARGKECYALETMYSWDISEKLKNYRKLFFNLLYTQTVDYDINKTIRENEANLFSAAIKSNIVPKVCDVSAWSMPFPKSAIPSPYYIVVPGSSNKKRQWPEEYFAQIIDHIAEVRPDITAVITGTDQDITIAEKIIQCTLNHKKIINLCGKSTLHQLIHSIENADFIVTNDTASMHIAGSLRKICFCLGGNWHYGAYMPEPYYPTVIFMNKNTDCKRCMENCPYLINDRFRCLMQVTVEEVISIIDQTLFK